MLNNIDLCDILDKYDKIYTYKEMIDLKINNDIFKKNIIISGIIRNIKYRQYNNKFRCVDIELYNNFLSSCNDNKLKCYYNYNIIYENNKEVDDKIFNFLLENENKKILLEGLLHFAFLKIDEENDDELYEIYFDIKNVKRTRYNIILNNLQKEININYKKEINWNNINNIAVITDINNNDTFIFQNNIDKRYNCMYFDLKLNNNFNSIEKNFKKILKKINKLNINNHFDFIILLFNNYPLDILYNFDTYNISKLIYYFNIPFCSIISYNNKQFNNEDLVISKITSFDFIDYNYALDVLNKIMKNNHSINLLNYSNISNLIFNKSLSLSSF